MPKLILLKFLFLLICLENGWGGGTTAFASKVDPDLSQRLEAGESVNVLVSFSNGVKATLAQASALRLSDRVSQNNAVVEALEENADNSQASVIHQLSTRSGGGNFKYFKKYWISNRLFVKEADAATVKMIDEDPNVSRIQVEPVSKLEPISFTEVVSVNALQQHARVNGEDSEEEPYWNAWNVEIIQAPEAWNVLENKSGDGVIVGTIDSGVRHTHELIRHNFRGVDNYGWFDPINGTSEPYDSHGHGSHVMGLFVGGIKIGMGVAPGATWMTCIACPSDDCPYEYVSDCMTWMACPTLPDGTGKDCSKAPKVINVSIGDNRGTEAYKDEIDTWRSLGIIPVIAIGNEGPNCSTTVAPGELPNVIGVGATGEKDDVYSLGSIGPAYDGGMKPDLVAPGWGTYSAHNTGDDVYSKSRGTSNASPHVAGVVALLLVRNPELTYEQAYDLLINNTDVSTMQVNYKHRCPDYPDDIVPNYFYGYGRLNALKVIEAQSKLLGLK